MTHLSNLEGIIRVRKLLSHNQVKALGLSPTSIAYSDVQDRRAKKLVPLEPLGTLHDYVPFYFNPRSPMQYAIHCGHLKDRVKINELVFFVSSTETVAESGAKFVFTDGHAIMEFTRYASSISELSIIDWNIINQKYWNDKSKDPDSGRKRQAEFLIRDELELKYVDFVGVRTEANRVEVEKILMDNESKPEVKVKADYFFGS